MLYGGDDLQNELNLQKSQWVILNLAAACERFKFKRAYLGAFKFLKDAVYRIL